MKITKPGFMYLALLVTAVAIFAMFSAQINDLFMAYIHVFSFLFVSLLFLLLYLGLKYYQLQRTVVAGAATQTMQDEYSRKTEYLVNLSHDLCTPVYAILSYTDLLFKTSLTEKQRNYIGSIKSSGAFVIDVAREISLFRQYDNDEIEINNQEFTLGSVIDDVMEVMANRASLKKIDLICEYHDVFNAKCFSDPFRIKQILLNLVGNAIKFTNDGYVLLNLDLQEDGDKKYLYFEVVDTGVGITEENQKKIFTPFYQLNYEMMKNVTHSGSGLGLAINMRLVSAMNGTIGIDSEYTGGAKFWVKIPCEYIETVQGYDARYSSLTGKKALVIESNLVLRDSLIQYFEFSGINSDSADNIRQARKLLATSLENNKYYDFVIVASNVAGECGLLVSKYIRDIPGYQHVPLVIAVPVSEQLTFGVVSSIQPAICLDKPVVPYKFKDVLSEVADMLQNQSDFVNETSNRTVLSLPKYKANKVLIVDDNALNRNVMLEMFEEMSFQADVEKDGESALKILGDNHINKYEVVILDCVLPGLDGYSVAKKIRTLDRDKQPVIVMTSSDNSDKNKLKCYKSGADEFLEKPVKISRLTKLLESWIPDKKELLISHGNSDDGVVKIFNSPILDDGIMQIMEQDELSSYDFVNQMYFLFIKETSTLLGEMLHAIEAEKYDKILKTSHGIKSGCLQFGAKGMARYCEVLANMAKIKNKSEIENTLQQLVDEYRRVMTEFENYQRRYKTGD